MALEARTLSRLLRLFRHKIEKSRLHHGCATNWKHKERRTGSIIEAHPARAPVFTPVSMFSHFSWIGKRTPGFALHGSNVKVLQEPDQFYQALKDGVRRAKRRIVLASLYLGTGPLEQQLVDSLYEACRQDKSRQLRVTILLDCIRGSRGEINSRTMLLPLVRDYGDQVNVSLYHTPHLRGLVKRFLPERWNETVGVQHLKVYLFDDDLLMSGANLSESYFTNRQDRYIMLQQCSALGDFYNNLVMAVGRLSFQLQPNDSLTLPEQLEHHPYAEPDGGTAYKAEGKKYLKSLLDCSVSNGIKESTSNREGNTVGRSTSTSFTGAPDTWVYPLVQMKTFGITVDDCVTHTLFEKATHSDFIRLASGYFNLTTQYMDTLLNKSAATFSILTASPQANGFYGGKGMSGGIPAAYTNIAKQFYERACQQCQQHRLELHEYSRHAWTFHGKGLWYYLAGQHLPTMTLIGSPNFGYRSVFRDLESQVAIVTDNANLRQQLQKEQEALYSRAEAVTEQTFQQPDRVVPYWVILMTFFVRSFL